MFAFLEHVDASQLKQERFAPFPSDEPLSSFARRTHSFFAPFLCSSDICARAEKRAMMRTGRVAFIVRIEIRSFFFLPFLEYYPTNFNIFKARWGDKFLRSANTKVTSFPYFYYSCNTSVKFDRLILGDIPSVYTGQIQFRHSKEHIFANISDRYFLYTHSYNTIFNWNPFIKEFILNGEYRGIRQWIKIFFERNVAKYIICSTNWLIVRHRTILVSLLFFNFSTNQTKFPRKL